LACLVRVVRNDNAAGGAHLQGGGVAACGGCVGAKAVYLCLDAMDGYPAGHPAIRHFRDGLHGSGPEGGDEDGYVWTVGLEAKGKAAFEVEPLAVVVERLLRNEGVDDLDGLPHAREGGIEWNAVEVLDDVGAGGPEADDHTALGNLVQ